jgi:hypothetical protein
MVTNTITVKRLTEIINETRACRAFVRRGNILGLILIRSIRYCSRHAAITHEARNGTITCHAHYLRVANSERTLPVGDEVLEHCTLHGHIQILGETDPWPIAEEYVTSTVT